MQSAGEELLMKAEALLGVRDVDGARAGFRAAESAGADADRCAAGRWMAEMLSGEFAAAWRESDAIRGRGGPDAHRFWMGEEIAGKRVMLRCLHGLGDAVQMLRYAPALRALAAKLIVEVTPELVELAGYFDGVDEVITWGNGAPAAPPEWDVQMEVVELPYIFRTGIEDLPVATRYLRVPAAEKPGMGAGGDRLRVGVVWASSAWNPARSVPLEMLRPLLVTPGCEFWNLQGGPAREDAARLSGVGNFHTDDRCVRSLLRLAQSFAEMDLVITVDTLAAHLAGAMGIPAWVMLQHAADWRWMLEREDSPWYPTLRLFRQRREGDWRTVVEAITAELDAAVTMREWRLVGAIA